MERDQWIVPLAQHLKEWGLDMGCFQRPLEKVEEDVTIRMMTKDYLDEVPRLAKS